MLTPINNVAAASNNYEIDGSSYELSDASDFDITDKKAQSWLCYGSGSIGNLVLSGSINEKTTYQGKDAIGATSAVSLTYSYNGAYQTDNIEQWNISPSTEKTVNGNELDNKVEKGALLVERSGDGKEWELVFVETNIFHKATSDISNFYTISEEDVRAGCHFRVSVAYRMEKKTGTENVIGFIPRDTYTYREFIEVRNFYICYNSNAVTFRDIESGKRLYSTRTQKGFIVDKCGTNIDVVIKDIASGRERKVSDLTSVIDPGSYKITISTVMK